MIRIATDRVEVLLAYIEAGIPIKDIPGLQICVLQSEWNELPHYSRSELLHLRKLKIIDFIDTDKILFSEVFSIKKRHGEGVSMNNYFVLRFCINQQLPLLTSDSTILRVAKALKIQTKRPDAFQVDLLIESIGSDEETSERLKMIRKKMKGNMST